MGYQIIAHASSVFYTDYTLGLNLQLISIVPSLNKDLMQGLWSEIYKITYFQAEFANKDGMAPLPPPIDDDLRWTMLFCWLNCQ